MLRDGLQVELLLLIADNQPLQRAFLSDLFSGDKRQRHNTIFSLKAKGWIELTQEGHVLTVTGEEEAKQISAKQAQDQRAIKPKVVPAMLLRRPDAAKTDEYQTKINLLKDLAKPMAPEFAAVLASIQQDIKKLHGVTV